MGLIRDIQLGLIAEDELERECLKLKAEQYVIENINGIARALASVIDYGDPLPVNLPSFSAYSRFGNKLPDSYALRAIENSEEFEDCKISLWKSRDNGHIEAVVEYVGWWRYVEKYCFGTLVAVFGVIVLLYKLGVIW